jgi:hypothetical protein
MSEMPRQNPLGLSIFTLKKKKDRRAKQVVCRGGSYWEGGGPKERVNESEYGRCIFYSYMKIRE